MFYSQVILSRKGPLGKIWLAAHFDKKLTKNQIFSTDISDSVESVLNPANPLALRVSGHLMLGIVRIHSRKVKYLMTDCTEAMWKIKLAFQPGNVDIDPIVDAGANIDDNRFYGNVDDTTDFPAMDSYPQFLLSSYQPSGADTGTVNSGASKTKDLLTLENPSLDDRGVSPSPLSSTRAHQLVSSNNSKHSRVSDVELMRGENARLSTNFSRVSITSGAADPRGSSISAVFMNAEDDIPAFEEYPMDQGFDTFQPQEQNMALMNMDYDQKDNYEENYQIESALEPVVETKDDTEIQDVEVEVGKKRGRKPTKKQKVTIDSRVELTNRVIKQRMAELGPILRRDPAEPLTFSRANPVDEFGNSGIPLGENETMDERINNPHYIRGICPELQEIYAMASNEVEFPFPLKQQIRENEIENNNNINNTSAAPSVEIMRNAEDRSYMMDEDNDRLSFLNTSLHSAQNSRKSGLQPEFNDFGEIDFNPLPMQDDYQVEVEVPFQVEVEQGQSMDEPLLHSHSPYEFEEHKTSNTSDLDRVTAFRPKNLKIGGKRTELSEMVNEVMKEEQKSLKTTPGAKKGRERTNQLLELINSQVDEKVNVTFQDMTIGVPRATAASCFLEILQLKTWGKIETKQENPFSEIMIQSV